MTFWQAAKKCRAPKKINVLKRGCLQMATTNRLKKSHSPMQKPKSYWHILLKRKSQTPCQNIPRENPQQFRIPLRQHQRVRDWFQPHSQSNTRQITEIMATSTNAKNRHFVLKLIQINSSCRMLKSPRPMQILVQFHKKSLVPQSVTHPIRHILN